MVKGWRMEISAHVLGILPFILSDTMTMVGLNVISEMQMHKFTFLLYYQSMSEKYFLENRRTLLDRDKKSLEIIFPFNIPMWITPGMISCPRSSVRAVPFPIWDAISSLQPRSNFTDLLQRWERQREIHFVGGAPLFHFLPYCSKEFRGFEF